MISYQNCQFRGKVVPVMNDNDSCPKFERKVKIRVLNVNGERFRISGQNLLIAADAKNKHSYTLQVSALAIISNDWQEMEQFS